MDDFLASLQAGIEERLREQIARHRRIDSNADTHQVIEIQMRHERERLKTFASQHPELEDVVRAITDDWLPDLERRLKGR